MKRNTRVCDVVGIPPKCHVYSVVYYNGTQYVEHQVAAERVDDAYRLAFYIGKRIVAMFSTWASVLEVTE
jgi:hypothetical protein